MVDVSSNARRPRARTGDRATSPRDATRTLVGGAEAAFRRAHPRYDETTVLDELRRTDFARLDAGGHVYLDYTGAGLYAESQLREHIELLRAERLRQPALAQPDLGGDDRARRAARARRCSTFFRASPDEYVAIFTPNATGALRLVGEAYPFRAGRPLPAHLRQPQLGQRHPRVRPRPRRRDDLRPERAARPARRRAAAAALPDRGRRRAPQPVRLPGAVELLRRPAPARLDRAARTQHGWDVLLDAAAFVPTNRLDLSRWHPDFVALSFYKMFG